MWTILKVFTEFLTVLLLFYALVSRSGSQLPDQGSNPHSLSSLLEDEVLTTGPPEQPPLAFLMTECRFKCSPFAFFGNLGIHFFRVFWVHPRQR